MFWEASMIACKGCGVQCAPEHLINGLCFCCDEAAGVGKPMTQADRIAFECDYIKAILLSKNEKYGDSAMSPVRIFSRGGATEGIRARIDDKLSRIMASEGRDDEDTILDLIGYLLLLRIATRSD
jgi:hypothetical protein